MADYIFEVGVDRHAEPGPDGTYPLFFNVCKPNVPAWTTQFQSGETFMWHFFDYTEAPEPAPPDQLQIMGFTVSMVYAHDRKFLIPILPRVPLCFGQNCIPEESGIMQADIGSEIFPKIVNGWNLPFEKKESGTFTFPTVVGRKAILHFGLIAIVLTDSGRQELRHYGHDPEIIVGPGT